MPGSFSQLYVHAVFSFKFREALINPDWEDRLFAVMNEALRELGHTPIIANGTTDHVHLLWRHNRTQTLSHTIKIIKGRSSKFINDMGLTETLFRWQGGYGAFSVSVDRVPTVTRYIRKQKQHHATITVRNEMESLLLRHGEPDPQHFVFDELA